MKSFRELDVWNKAMELTDRVYDLVGKFPKEERYALGDQLRRAVVSIPSNIAEGFGRDTHKDFAHFLAQARGSLYEVDTQIEIAVRRSYILKDTSLSRLMNDVAKMLASLSRHLRVSQANGVSTQSTRHEAQSTKHDGAPKCPLCGKVMRKRLCRKGRNAGHSFWSCSAYPECRGTRDC